MIHHKNYIPGNISVLTNKYNQINSYWIIRYDKCTDYSILYDI